MEIDDTLVEILKLCISIDGEVADTYNRFFTLAENDELKTFWKEMSNDENTHGAYWTYLLNLTEQGLMPQIFDNPHQIKEELENIQRELDVLDLDTLIKQSSNTLDVTYSFVTACRLEFYMLHRAFANLLHFVRYITDEQTPVDDYDVHLTKFINALNKFSRTPELEILGETIQRVWEENKDLVMLSNNDPLTGVFSRRGFFQTITPLAHLAHRNKYNIGVMMIDIDHFKKVNATHGHQAGDKILKFVANSIKSHVRRSDILGRYVGDEFIVYLSEFPPNYLDEVSEKIRNCIEVESKDGIPVTVCIGVSHKILSEEVEKEIEELTKKAGECLLQAKTTGGNKIIMSN